MFLKIQNTKRGPYMTIMEKYWDQKDGRAKDRIVERLGYASQYEMLYADPVEHFRDVVKKRNEENAQSAKESISIRMDSDMNIGELSLQNVGYGILKRIYKELEIDRFWKRVERKTSPGFSLDKVFQLMVYCRTLFKSPPTDISMLSPYFFEEYGTYTEAEIQRALRLISLHEADLLRWIYEHSATLYSRDLSVLYFAGTDFYISYGKQIRQQGAVTLSREKAAPGIPCRQLGILLDRDGIPVTAEVAPPQELFNLMELPRIRTLASMISLPKIILFANNSIPGLDRLLLAHSTQMPRLGYLFCRRVADCDDWVKRWALSDKGMEFSVDSSFFQKLPNECQSKRYKVMYRNIALGSSADSGNIWYGKQKLFLSRSEWVAEQQKAERENLLSMAGAIASDSDAHKPVSPYLTVPKIRLGTQSNGETLPIDENAVREDAAYDGLYVLATSEIDAEQPDLCRVCMKLRTISSCLSTIEASLDSQSPGAEKGEDSPSHFAICFTSLFLVRTLQHELGEKYPAPRLLQSLRKYSCTHLVDNRYQMIYYDEVIDDCAELLKEDLKSKYKSRMELRRFLRY